MNTKATVTAGLFEITPEHYPADVDPAVWHLYRAVTAMGSWPIHVPAGRDVCDVCWGDGCEDCDYEGHIPAEVQPETPAP